MSTLDQMFDVYNKEGKLSDRGNGAYIQRMNQKIQEWGSPFRYTRLVNKKASFTWDEETCSFKEDTDV